MDTAEKLAAEIKRRAQRSSEPITLYINCGGGRLAAFWMLANLCNSNQLHSRKRSIIMVANFAGSAAAYLLVLGQPAYAKKGGRLYFHGTRTNSHRKIKTLTLGNAVALTLRFEQQNRDVADKLTAKILVRLVERYCHLRRGGNFVISPNRTQSFWTDFSKRIAKRLSSGSPRKLLAAAVKDFSFFYPITLCFVSENRRLSKKRLIATQARLYDKLLKNYIKLKCTPKNGIDANTAAAIMLDYLQACDFIQCKYLRLVHCMVESYGSDFLNKKQTIIYHKLKRRFSVSAMNYLVCRVRPYILGFLCFALMLSRGLMLGSYTLKPRDAYWLGLIDKVID